MKIYSCIGICFIPLLLFAAIDDCQIQINIANEHKIVIELDIKKYQYLKKDSSILINGTYYDLQPGLPKLPVKSFLLQIPSYSKYIVNVIRDEIEILNEIEIAPYSIPNVKRNNQSPFGANNYSSSYTLNAGYPQNVIELEYPGFIRNCYLLQVKVNIAQYNPIEKSVKIHKRLKLELIQQNTLFPVNSQGPDFSSRNEHSPDFDKIIEKRVMNYTSNSKGYQSQLIKRSLDTSGKFQAVDFYRRIAPFEKYKVIVKEEGVYKITGTELLKAGLDLFHINSCNIHLYNKGKEISVYIENQVDSLFQNEDYILFYATSNITTFSNDNIYWLVMEDTQGKRMEFVDGTPTQNWPKPYWIKTKTHLEKDSVYTPNTSQHWKEYDHWAWTRIPPQQEQSFQFTLPGVVSKESLRARFELLCYGLNYEHQNSMKVFLNQYMVADTSWKYEKPWEFNQPCQIMKTIPNAYLNNGQNVIRLQSKSPVNSESIILDWFEIEYHQKFQAEQDRFKFTPEKQGNYRFQITGFTTDSIYVFEIDTSGWVKRGEDYLAHLSGNSNTLEFQAVTDPSKKYFCISADQLKQPVNILKDSPSYLFETSQQSDYIMICHQDFIPAIQPLAAFHQGNRMNVTIIDVDNIYDEFNYGLFNPQAIKTFLQYTYYNWHTPIPTYVLLVGDASYDYRNKLEFGFHNYVPTNLNFPNEMSSDNWFVCVSGTDWIPDMFIGRLPVRTANEVTGIVTKILNYQADYTHQEWRRRLLFVADKYLRDENDQKMTDELIRIVPPEYMTRKMYLDDISNAWNMREKLVDTISDGCLIVTYTGHGGISQWSHSKIFQMEDVAQLTNNGKLALFVAFSCSTGMFFSVKYECLAEALLKSKDNGAIASWVATGSPYIIMGNPLGQEFYNSLFEEGINNMGALVTNTLLQYLTRRWPVFWEVAAMYTLFGDPAIDLKLFQPDAPKISLKVDNREVLDGDYVRSDPIFSPVNRR